MSSYKSVDKEIEQVKEEEVVVGWVSPGEDESSRYIYQERELVFIVIKVGLILLRIKV